MNDFVLLDEELELLEEELEELELLEEALEDDGLTGISLLSNAS